MTIASSLGNANEVAEATATTLAAIGERIRKARRKRDMTLQALAEKTKLSVSMLSLVERGRASPSIGSLVVVSSALGITMSELMASHPAPDDELVVRASQQHTVETAEHVIRKLIREDPARGVSIATNEYQPNTGNSDVPVTHAGFEYGFVLEGTLTVEVDKTSYLLKPGDLISGTTANARCAHCGST